MQRSFIRTLPQNLLCLESSFPWRWPSALGWALRANRWTHSSLRLGRGDFCRYSNVWLNQKFGIILFPPLAPILWRLPIAYGENLPGTGPRQSTRLRTCTGVGQLCWPPGHPADMDHGSGVDAPINCFSIRLVFYLGMDTDRVEPDHGPTPAFCARGVIF